eukprot:jgi/Picsp_1/6295/NSC_03645-R1_---NA---
MVGKDIDNQPSGDHEHGVVLGTERGAVASSANSKAPRGVCPSPKNDNIINCRTKSSESSRGVPSSNGDGSARQLGRGGKEEVPPSLGGGPSDVGLDGSGSDVDGKKVGSKTKKQTNRKDPYERQKQYRERKKKKATEVEERLQECFAKLEALRQVNERIRRQNESLLMMHSYWDDSISQFGLGQPSCKDAKEKVNAPEMKIKEEIMNHGLGAVLEQIMDPFMKLRKEPDNYVVKKLASYVISKWDRETREHCQMKIQNKLSTLLRHYYDATSEEVKNEYDRKIDILIQTRRRLADFMVQFHPEFVMARILEGWVEKGFDRAMVGEDSVEIEQACVSFLISKLRLSTFQIEEVSMAWSQFVSSWNRQLEAHNSFVQKLEQGTDWSSTYGRGMHTGMRASLELRNATHKLKENNKIKAMIILTLSNRLHSLLSPIQLAHLGTFFPAYTPNWADFMLGPGNLNASVSYTRNDKLIVTTGRDFSTRATNLYFSVQELCPV